MAIDLTNRQKAFADVYVATGNATQSAIEAGYSRRSARTTGARMLANADVRTRIAGKIERLECERIATMGEVLQFLTDVMRGRVKDAFGLDANISDRLVAARELLKRFDAADGRSDALARLDAILSEFRSVVYDEKGDFDNDRE